MAGVTAVAVAGTVDNLDELAADLRAAGVAPEPVTPAGVVAALFDIHGEQAPSLLRGVFAVLATDGARLFCVRDQVGFASLFYRDDGRSVWAATEAKQVVAGAGIRKEPDVAVLTQRLYGAEDDETPAGLRGVDRVPKASIVVAELDRIRTLRYWDPEPLLETARLSGDDIQERFDALMAQAVRRCLTANGDVLSLSGGIDSPAVAAFAAEPYRELSGRPLRALSAVFPDHPSVDERPYIELVSGRLGLELHTFVQRVNPLEHLAEWAALADGPTLAGSLPHYADFYRRVRRLGGRTALSGEFEELVAELDAYLLHRLLAQGALRPLRRRLRGSRPRRAAVVVRTAASLFEPPPLTAVRWRRRSEGVPAWVDRRRANEAAARSAVRSSRRWATIQLQPLRGPGPALEAEEVCQAVCGVRARRPWADIDLWELFLSLPAQAKHPEPGSKPLVRRLLRGRVPDEILDRRDKTFFDASIEASIDYPALRQWLLDPPHRIDGVDYGALGERLRCENLSLVDYMWAKNLAGVHAFLSLW